MSELSRTPSTKKTYSPDSNNDLDELTDDRTCSMAIDNSNIIMKTPQSLDDLLDTEEKSENDATEEVRDEENGKIEQLAERFVSMWMC